MQLYDSIWSKQNYKNHCQRNVKEKNAMLAARTVATDGFAPQSAMTSAGIVNTWDLT